MTTDTMGLSSKPRFEILDGLRGVAAIIVVVFHLFETYSAGPCFQILNHGYLAVDFFFVLSGFVIGYAYDDRWSRMSTWDFFKRRLIRLQPMLVLGTLIGAFWFYFGDAPAFSLVAETPWWKLLLIAAMGCLMFPTPPSMDIRGWREINSLNGAAWSLMWEYVANIIYALFIRRFSTKLLAVFVLLSAFLTIDLAMDVDSFSMLQLRDAARYTVIGGFGLSADQIYIGIARLLYPFFAGLLLYRLGYCRICIKSGAMTWCSLAIAAVLVMPHLGGDKPNWVNGLYCALVILVIFPAIVAAGAGSRLIGKKTTALCKWLGMISYPLYITHYPMIYVQMNWAANHPNAPSGTHIWVGVSIFLAAIAVAYASVKVYDIPIRKWLSEKWLRPRKSVHSQIDHIAIWAQDIECLRKFYTDFFGAESSNEYHNPTKDFTSYFLTFGNGARIEIMHRNGLTDSATSTYGFAHIAISVGYKNTVDTLTERLHRAGLRVISLPRKTGDGYYESVIADPEGNIVEITV